LLSFKCNLYRYAEDARGRLRESLSYAMDALVAVAHTSRGELERYAAAETMALNKASIEDRRGMAELLRRLRVREVEKERFERAAWVAALEKWRNLRTDHSINVFVQRIRSDEFADPPARHALVRDLAEEQGKSHASLTEQVSHLQSLLPPVSMSTDAIQGWRAGLAMLHEAWDAAIGRSVSRLKEAEAALQTSALEAFEVLKLDVARYAAADEAAQAAVLEKRAMGPMNERATNASSFIARLNAFTAGQSSDWKLRAGKLSDFALAVATLRDDHRRSSVGIHDDNVGDLADRRTEHERRDDANEAAFEGACDDMAHAPSEHALDDKLDAALARLDDVELNYRDFHTEMVVLAESNPVKQREDGEGYQRKLCRLLRIMPNVAPLERRKAPAAMPLKGDAPAAAEEAAAAPAEGEEGGEGGEGGEGEEEEEQWAFDPSDESKQFDFVLTQKGNQFRVWTAIYEDIYYPPPPPPPPAAEGEEAAAEAPPEPEAAPAEGEEGYEPPREPTPEPEPEPIPYLAELTITVGAVQLESS
jgi:cation transport regulator ChaC